MIYKFINSQKQAQKSKFNKWDGKYKVVFRDRERGEGKNRE